MAIKIWTGLVFASVLSLFLWNARAAEYNVVVGNYSSPVSADDPRTWVFHRFFPSTFNITVNDMVTFTAGAGFHDIVFAPTNPPLISIDRDGQLRWNDTLLKSNGTVRDSSTIVSSGLLMENQSFTFNFTEPGNYTFYDPFYPALSGLISVLDSPESTPQSVAQNANTEYNQLNSLVPRLNEQYGIFFNISAPYMMNRNGTRTYRIRTGVADPTYYASFPYFLPSLLNINPGDSVEFVNNDINFHTAYFNSSGIFDPSGFFTFENTPENQTVQGLLTSQVNTDSNLGPRVIVGERYAFPIGNTSNYVSGEAGSGLLFPFTYLLSNHSFNFTFPQQGNYPFASLVYSNKNMIGTIQVGGPMATSSPTQNPPTKRKETRFTRLFGENYPKL